MLRPEDLSRFVQNFGLTNFSPAIIQEAERYNEEIVDDRDCLAWRPSPSCKVLYENVPPWYVPQTAPDKIGHCHLVTGPAS